MKIGLISDLHTDATEANRAIIPILIDAIKTANLDVFVLAGDITPKLTDFYEILGEFAEAKLTCRKFFVPGNHDIWVNKEGNMTSAQKCRVISEICRDHGFHPLNESPQIIDSVGFCGTIGWYDYTYASDKYDFTQEQYAEKQLMGAVWSDKRYVIWSGTDPEVSQRFEEELSQQISSIRSDVERIIVVTHHVPFRECIRYRNELPWDYFRAFYGSVGLGNISLQEPLVSHVLFGHIHYPVNQQIDHVRAICAPIGYFHEHPSEGLETFVQNRLTCFTIAHD